MAARSIFPRTTPEAQGIPSAAVLDFLDACAAQNLELHSLMLLRNGAVTAEGWWAPFAANLSHMLFSLSKSFTSTAVGLAVAEGRLTVNDPVVSFFPEDCPAAINPNLAAMQVRHLLSMSTGHHEDTTGRVASPKNPNWVKAFLALEVEHEPGTFFVYNSGASFMLSAIVQKLTGMKLIDYLRPRLFDPLGIRGATWETAPGGINMGGWGLKIKTEDIARFGQLYLQKGIWRGQRILPEAWVEEATRKQVPNGDDPNSDWNQGYGYQFWRCRHNIYRGDGAFGQYCIVMPEQNAVLAINSGVGDMQAVLNNVWNCLLASMKDSPLPPNPVDQEKLTARLNSLAYEAPQGPKKSPLAEKIGGRTYVVEPHPMKFKTVKLDLQGETFTLTVEQGRKTHQLTGGMSAWVKGKTAMFNRSPWVVVTSGVWTHKDTFTITTRAYETPFYYTLTLKFVGEQVTVDVDANVGFGPEKVPQLVGKAAGG